MSGVLFALAPMPRMFFLNSFLFQILVGAQCLVDYGHIETGCRIDIRVHFYFPNLARSSSTTFSSNFLNNGPG
jgi:hypothetical protein